MNNNLNYATTFYFPTFYNQIMIFSLFDFIIRFDLNYLIILTKTKTGENAPRKAALSAARHTINICSTMPHIAAIVVNCKYHNYYPPPPPPRHKGLFRDNLQHWLGGFCQTTCGAVYKSRNEGSLYVSGKLPTCPSPEPIFCPK